MNGNANDKELLRRFRAALEARCVSQASEIGMRIVTELAKTHVVKFARSQGHDDIADFLENYYAETADLPEEEEDQSEAPPQAEEAPEAPEEPEEPEEPEPEEPEEQEPEQEQEQEQSEETETDEYDDQDSIGEE